MRQLVSNSKPWLAYFVTILFLIGMYIPTSIGGVQSRGAVAASVGLLGLLFPLLLFLNGVGRQSLIFIALSIPLILIVSTFISPLMRMEFGAIYMYCMLGLFFLLRLNNIHWRPVIGRAFLLVNILNVIIGVGIIVQYDPILEFLKTHYTYFYPELLPLMFAVRKPVIVFGTHSVTGFFFFVFFWLNLRTYEVTRKRFYLGLAIIYMLFSVFLFSFTSLFFFAVEAVLLLKTAMHYSRKLAIVAVLLIGIGGVLIWQSFGDWKYDVLDYAANVLQSKQSGLAGRYAAASGDLVHNLEFIRDHPLRPIGLTVGSDLLMVDSGPVEYMLRGSVPLLLAIYLGLFGFLQTNLLEKRDLIVLLAAFLLFEVGFSILTYPRTLYLIPFFVVYLNAMHEAAEGSVPVLKSQALAA